MKCIFFSRLLWTKKGCLLIKLLKKCKLKLSWISLFITINLIHGMTERIQWASKWRAQSPRILPGWWAIQSNPAAYWTSAFQQILALTADLTARERFLCSLLQGKESQTHCTKHFKQGHISNQFIKDEKRYTLSLHYWTNAVKQWIRKLQL